jgi:hypothetical protein
MTRDVLASGGESMTGGGYTLGMTVGETVVGLSLTVPGAQAQIAGFWNPGAGSVLDAGGPSLARPAPAARTLEVAPNPFERQALIRFAAPRAAEADEARAAIYDTRGRRIRGLEAGARDAHSVSFTWDGRDSEGRHAGPGIYFCRVQSGSIVLTRRLARVR